MVEHDDNLWVNGRIPAAFQRKIVGAHIRREKDVLMPPSLTIS